MTGDNPPVVSQPQPLLTARFAVLCSCGVFYFMSLGLVYPVLPGFVENDLGGGPVAVGLAVGLGGGPVAVGLAVGLGGLILGGVVEVSSYSMAFFAGGSLSLVALVVSRTLVRPRLEVSY